MTAPHLYQVEDGWVEIYPGTQFHFGDPQPGEIRVESIAHSLARMCRYNGHTTRHYSVGEHVCHISDWVMKQPWATPLDGLTALHHDDAEYIIGDQMRPIKVTMPQFMTLEKILDQSIADEFGTIYPFPPWLKEADTRILKDERYSVMTPSPHDWGVDVLEKLGVKFWGIAGRWPWLVKRRYLARHNRLWKQIHGSDFSQRGWAEDRDNFWPH